MKTVFSSLLCALIIGFSSVVHAIPFIYSFSGNVGSISENDIFKNSLSVDSTTFTVGDTLEYSFLIDFSADGYCLDPSALASDQCSGSGIDDVPGFDFYYAELTSANKQVSKSYYDIEYNYGVSQFAGSQNGQVFGSSAVLLQAAMPVQDWQVGDFISGFDYWDNGLFASEADYGVIESFLTLDRIELVSEPTVLMMLALGFFIIFAGKLNPRRHAPGDDRAVQTW